LFAGYFVLARARGRSSFEGGVPWGPLRNLGELAMWNKKSSKHRLVVFCTALFLMQAMPVVAKDVVADQASLSSYMATYTEASKRIISITYPGLNNKGEMGIHGGSGYMLDAHRAITAAHVVYQAYKEKNPVAVQIGAAGTNADYLTMARVIKIDAKRDLAILWVDAIDKPASALDNPNASICKEGIKRGDNYIIAGTSREDAVDVVHQVWRYPPDREIKQALGTMPLPELKADRSTVGLGDATYKKNMFAGVDFARNWKSGDEAIILPESVDPGYSGSGVISSSGCLAGIVSAISPLKEPLDNVKTITIAVPISYDDQFLRK
jgi:hypothetical protein